MEIGLPMKSDSIASDWDSSSRNRSITGCAPRIRNSRASPNWRASRRISRRISRSEEHTSELQSLTNLVCRLLLEKKKKNGRKHEETPEPLKRKNIQHNGSEPAISDGTQQEITV